ncbi:DUF421 domain-containing protein [Hymenobacter sp.]|jgi:uncharacterized membrane protein YcaP (DUF421 family)|uniref:DUF421 domain-containing protein n=1 Tax=Hymenobacter sp. TaxID=1898978 RepID=UPI002ED879AD
MKKEDIHLGDWHRILFGDTPGVFTWEVVVRTIIIYLIFLVVMRLLSKRMSAQLTITELGVMIMLGGIVAVPMQIPNRGLLPGALLLICVLIYQRGLSWLSLKKRSVELAVQGDVTVLVKDGVMQINHMRDDSISHNEVFAQLRDRNIKQLGEVKRLYLEGNGSFSVFKNDAPIAGLSVLPVKDHKLNQTLQPVDHQKVCLYCGQPDKAQIHSGKQCPNCGHDQWTNAVK